MTKRYTGVLTKEENWYVARCLELDVTSQGHTVEDAQANLREAIDLYVDSFGEEDLPESASGVMMYPLEVTANA